MYEIADLIELCFKDLQAQLGKVLIIKFICGNYILKLQLEELE